MHLHHPTLLPTPTVLSQNALHLFDCRLRRSLCTLFEWVSLPNYMPTIFLTLFAALAYAAPVAPQGAILKRDCQGFDECRNINTVSVVWCLYQTVIA